MSPVAAAGRLGERSSQATPAPVDAGSDARGGETEAEAARRGAVEPIPAAVPIGDLVADDSVGIRTGTTRSVGPRLRRPLTSPGEHRTKRSDVCMVTPEQYDDTEEQYETAHVRPASDEGAMRVYLMDGGALANRVTADRVLVGGDSPDDAVSLMDGIPTLMEASLGPVGCRVHRELTGTTVWLLP